MSERFLCGVFSYRIMREEKEEGREMGEEKEEGREEEEVPEGFLEAVNKFCDAYDFIFKRFDEIYMDYLRGEDIRKQLRNFEKIAGVIFPLIRDLFSREEKVKKWLAKEHVEEEKIQKIMEFKRRYPGLESEIEAFIWESYGYFHLTGLSTRYTFDPRHGFPVIELHFFSGSREILHLRDPVGWIYNLARRIQEEVKECLREAKGYDIDPDEIKRIEKVMRRIELDLEDMRRIIEEIKGRRKGGE